jgi:hypothetical protein
MEIKTKLPGNSRNVAAGMNSFQLSGNPGREWLNRPFRVDNRYWETNPVKGLQGSNKSG